MPKVLFICKRRQTEYGVSYGLLNSCRFLCNALAKIGIEGKVVSVVDNNCIDREVHQFKPTHVFIEALWVIPEKFHVLLPLHKNVKWYVRLHSNIPFLANEGMAMEWLVKYDKLQKQYPNFFISPNSKKLVDALWKSRRIKTVYSPNVYDPDPAPKTEYIRVPIDDRSDVLNVGCFGAIRPMKNHLTQAVAAMVFANKIGKTLHFHINGGRFEQNGEQTHRNLVHLFAGTLHKLVEHPWMNHGEFLGLVKKMDLGMQISFSETFNIVAADFVASNIPIVGSREISWMNLWYKEPFPTDVDEIVLFLYLAYYGRKLNLQALNKIGLDVYNYKALDTWVELLV
jgi:hypothetical protein